VSSTIWTPTAVASEARPVQREIWRAVEAQHHISTLALVDTLAEQTELEALLEASKPALPPEADRLHWLLSTPFRYPPLSHGSRFRGPATAGVFYGADEIRTACAELGYWRWRFLIDSPELGELSSRPQTVFSASISTNAVDLQQPPFDLDRAAWTHSSDYSACQDFAVIAREAGIGAIRYQSVRDPLAATCTALLTPAAFVNTPPVVQSWFLSVTRRTVFWVRDYVFSKTAFEFDAAQWTQ
jgi:hypothetical protein